MRGGGRGRVRGRLGGIPRRRPGGRGAWVARAGGAGDRARILGALRRCCGRSPDTAIDQFTGPPAAVSVTETPPCEITSGPPDGVTTSVPGTGRGEGAGVELA